MVPWATIRALLVAVAIAAPLPIVLRRAQNEKLTWVRAILLGSWLITITLVLVAEVPSRILYYFDGTHATLSARFPVVSFMEKTIGGVGVPAYQIVADMIANGVQVTFVAIIAAGAYFWGERHRKAGKFKS